jgi:nucleotide-binding universal stress UspA family protein
MRQTLIWIADDGPGAAAAMAFGIWLSDCLGAHARPFTGASVEGVLAAAAEHEALLVTAGRGNGSGRGATDELIRRFPGQLAVLPPAALELWLDPHEARRRAGRVIVTGCNGTASSIGAAELAGGIAAQLRGKVLVVHAARGQALMPARSSPLDRDPIGLSDRASRRTLLSPALAAARAQGAAAKARLFDGAPLVALADLAASRYAPLIVVGASRSVGSYSLAAELVARQDRPVLIAAAQPGAANPGFRRGLGWSARAPLDRLRDECPGVPSQPAAT